MIILNDMPKTNKQNIMVVVCASSGINYIEDIRQAGYNPVILELYTQESLREAMRKALDEEYARIPGELPVTYAAKEDYADTLEMVREVAPCAIIPGTDLGIELATRLAWDLGLPGNDPMIFPWLREKDKMQLAAKAAGLRYVRGKVVTTVEEGVRFFKEELGGKSAIVKPLRGSGSQGVAVCLDEEQLRKALSDDLEMVRQMVDPTSAVLVQERIIGEEYYVNTVTLNGETVVTNVVHYDERKLTTERPVYVCAEMLQPADARCQMLMDYVVRVVKATGLEIGPAHTEVMVDEKGPVLIEINARIAGADQPAGWQDQVLGLHESDIALRAYLGKDIHQTSYNDHRAVPSANGEYAYYPLVRSGCYNFAPTLHDIDAEEFIGRDLIESLPSLHSYKGFEAPKFYPATKDLFTITGLVFMVNDSGEQLKKDFQSLLDIEMNHIERLFKIKVKK